MRKKVLLCHSNVSAQECPLFWTLLVLVTISQIHSWWKQINSTACIKEVLALIYFKCCTGRTGSCIAAPLFPLGLILISFTWVLHQCGAPYLPQLIQKYKCTGSVHSVLWGGCLLVSYSRGFCFCSPSSFPEPRGSQWECGVSNGPGGSAHSSWGSHNRPLSPRTSITLNSVLMRHARLLAPETQVLSFSLGGVSQDLEQQFNLSPCYALSSRRREGSPVTLR